MKVLKAQMKAHELVDLLRELLSNLETMSLEDPGIEVSFYTEDEEISVVYRVYVTLIHLKDRMIIGYLYDNSNDVIAINIHVDGETVVAVLHKGS